MPQFSWRQLFTLGVCLAGVAVFTLLSLPLPVLMGPLIACLLVALAGGKLAGFGGVTNTFRTVLGVTAGTSITPDVIDSIPQMVTSLLFIPLMLVAVFCCSYPLFRRVFGYDHPTAYYGCMPGGLMDMLIFGEQAGGNVRTMSLLHATRVMVIVIVAPIFITWLWDIDLSATPGQPVRNFELHQVALMIFAALGGWWFAAKVKMFGASILGPLLFTALLSVTGIIHQRPPLEMIWGAQFFIGMSLGCKYLGITVAELKRDVLAGVLNVLMLAVVTVVFVLALELLFYTPPLETFLSFLPGGQGEMVLIAFIAGADMAFVVTHHILRIILVITVSPLVAKTWGR